MPPAHVHVDIYLICAHLSAIILIHISISYRKVFLGTYLAEFMWRRRVKIMGKDPFDQILADIATYYDSNEWRNYADGCIYASATTEKKQRKMFHQGVNLVGVPPLLIGCF